MAGPVRSQRRTGKSAATAVSRANPLKESVAQGSGYARAWGVGGGGRERKRKSAGVFFV